MTDAKGLYIHIPFCIKKCKYCDFVSYCKKEEYFDKYIDSLLCEALEYEGTKINRWRHTDNSYYKSDSKAYRGYWKNI